MSRLKAAWAESLQREAPGGTPHNTGVLFKCLTPECPATEDVVFQGGRMPPEAIRQKLQRKGWRIMRRGCLCPACQGKSPIQRVFEDMVSTTSKQEAAIREANERAAARVQVDPNPVPIPPAPSENQTMSARRVHRQVMGWLEEAYEEDAKRYKRGFSDQSIADETGAAVAYVAKCREDYFGVLGTPPEIETLMNALSGAHRELDDLRVTTKRAVDVLGAKVVKDLAAIQSKIDRTTESLQRLKQENGWK